jgi:hypothetical protein
MMSVKRQRVGEKKPRYNPVAIIMSLPKDLRDYIKSFWVGVRYPIIVRIDLPYIVRHWDNVYQCSIRGQGDDEKGAPPRFTCTPDYKELEAPQESYGSAPADGSSLAIATELAETFMTMVEEFPRGQPANDDGPDPRMNQLNIYSRCCAKHRVSISLLYDLEEEQFVFGHDAMSTKNIPEGVDLAYHRSEVEMLTLFGSGFNPRTAVQQVIERVLTHWTPCSDNALDCVEDAFELPVDDMPPLVDDSDDDLPPLGCDLTSSYPMLA